MKLTKRIYWDSGVDTATCIVAAGYGSGTITNFIELAIEAKKTFPHVTFDDIVCGTIRESQTMHGFPVILFRIECEKKDFRGWQSRDGEVDFKY